MIKYIKWIIAIWPTTEFKVDRAFENMPIFKFWKIPEYVQYLGTIYIVVIVYYLVLLCFILKLQGKFLLIIISAEDRTCSLVLTRAQLRSTQGAEPQESSAQACSLEPCFQMVC